MIGGYSYVFEMIGGSSRIIWPNSPMKRIRNRQSFTNDRKAANRSKRQRKKRFESARHLLIIHLHAHLGPSCQATGGFSYI